MNNKNKNILISKTMLIIMTNNNDNNLMKKSSKMKTKIFSWKILSRLNTNDNSKEDEEAAK